MTGSLLDTILQNPIRIKNEHVQYRYIYIYIYFYLFILFIYLLIDIARNGNQMKRDVWGLGGSLRLRTSCRLYWEVFWECRHCLGPLAYTELRDCGGMGLMCCFCNFFSGMCSGCFKAAPAAIQLHRSAAPVARTQKDGHLEGWNCCTFRV